jgi:glycosyltransferase involved in cell wall biosynthesis
MGETSNITVILPIVTLDNLEYEVKTVGEDGKEVVNKANYLNTCLNSITTQKVLPEEVLVIVSPTVDTGVIDSKIKESVNSDKINFRVIVNEGETDFASQINFGVEEVKTDYFSILEVDDQYATIWFDNVVKYRKWYDVDVSLPLCLDVNTDGKFLHFTNEPVWAKDFSDKQGFLDNDSLLNFPNFQLSGGIIKTESYKAVGGLKPTLKLQFIYEFLLRMSYYDKKMMTIPKLGYRKTNMRPGSLFHGYYHGDTSTMMNPVEARFWFNTARKESYFKTDRKITYIEDKVEA